MGENNVVNLNKVYGGCCNWPVSRAWTWSCFYYIQLLPLPCHLLLASFAFLSNIALIRLPHQKWVWPYPADRRHWNEKWCLFPLHLPIFMVFPLWCTSFLSGKLLLLPLTKALDFKQDLDPRRWTVAANWSWKNVRIGQLLRTNFPTGKS